MGLIVAEKFRGPGADREMHAHAITFDSAYVKDGDALSAADLGWAEIANNIDVMPLSGQYTFEYDASNEKLKVFASGSEVKEGTDLSAVSATVLSFGRNPSPS